MGEEESVFYIILSISNTIKESDLGFYTFFVIKHLKDKFLPDGGSMVRFVPVEGSLT